MEPSNVCCLQYSHIKRLFLTAYTNQPYVVYSMDLSKYVVYSMDPSTLCCLQHGPIKYVVHSMDPPTLCCLQYGPNTLTLLTLWDHHNYTVYIIGLVNLHSLQYDINNLRCLQYGPIHPFLQPDKHKPDTT